MIAPTDDTSTEVDDAKSYQTCFIHGIRQLKNQTHLPKKNSSSSGQRFMSDRKLETLSIGRGGGNAVFKTIAKEERK
jgi:hypothetical protein